MANDRLYVRCEFCGEFRFLGKFYPAHLGISLDDMATLREFMELHLECNPRYGGPDLGKAPGFGFYTEQMRTESYAQSPQTDTKENA